MRAFTNPIAHEVAMFVTRATGQRDRLRCPECKAIGTWKPHDGFIDTWWCWMENAVGKGLTSSLPPRGVRRWLCKWCGHYVGPEGVLSAFPDSDRGVWALPRPYDPDSPKVPGPTPLRALEALMGKTWPWRG